MIHGLLKTAYTTFCKFYQLLSFLGKWTKSDKWIKKIEEIGIVAVDTETNSLNPHKANLVGISLCYSPGVACYIPLEHATEKVPEKRLILECNTFGHTNMWKRAGY